MRVRLGTPIHVYASAALTTLQAQTLGAKYDLITVGGSADVSNLQGTLAAAGAKLGWYNKGDGGANGFIEAWYAHGAAGQRLGPNAFSVYSMQMDATAQGTVAGTAYNGWKPYHAQQVKDRATALGAVYTAPFLDSLGSDFSRVVNGVAAVKPGTTTPYTSQEWAAVIWQIVPAVRAKLGTSSPWVIICNGIDRSNQAQWTKCNIGMLEGWFGGPANPIGSHNSWLTNMQLAMDVAAAGVQPWLYCKISNTQWTTSVRAQMRGYGTASYFIALDPSKPALFENGPSEGGPPPQVQSPSEYTQPEYNVDLGSPTETFATPSGYWKAGTSAGTPGIYGRYFTKGIALVNTDTAPHTYTLLGTGWKTAAGVALTSTTVTVPAQSGVIYTGTPTGQAGPQVTLGAATAVGETQATLHGTVDANGAATTWQFEWGTTTAYGNTVTGGTIPGTNIDPLAVQATATGLPSGTLIHYRLTATSSGGTAHSADGTLTTLSTAAPTVATTAPTNLAQSSVTLNGTVNPKNNATAYYFEYGEGVSIVKPPAVGVVAENSNTFPTNGVTTDSLHVNWSELEAADQGGTLNGSGLARITTMINNATAAGKKWKLRLYCNGDRTGGDTGMPAWLKTAAGTFSYQDPQDSTTTLTLGRFWTQVVQDAYRRFILNLAQLLDDEATLVDVTISGGMMLYAEPMILGLSAPQNRAELVGGGNGWAGTFIPTPGAGYTQAAYVAAQQSAIKAHSDFFPKTHSSFAFNPQQVLTSYSSWLGQDDANLTNTKALIDYAVNTLGERLVPENNSARPDDFSYNGSTPTGYATGPYPDLYRYMAATGLDLFFQTANTTQIVNTAFPTVTAALQATMDALIGVVKAVAVEPNTISGTTAPGWTASLSANYVGPTTPVTTYDFATPSASAGSGGSPIAVSADVANLAPGIVYHYRLTATSSAGTVHTADGTFTTPGAPVPTTGTPTVTQTTAVLAGSIDPNGTAVTYHFAYGQTASYGSVTPNQTIAAGQANPVDVFANLTGLRANTTYHFALIANGVQSADASFTTPAVTAITETYQWQTSGDSGVTWQPAANSANTDQSYTVVSGDIGLLLRCLVRASDGNGHFSQVATAPIGPITAVSTGIIFHYQWQNSADNSHWGNASGLGASTRTYTVDPTDATLWLRCLVTAINSFGSAQMPSNVIGPVAAPGGNQLTAQDEITVTVSSGGNTLTAHDSIHVQVTQAGGPGPFDRPWAVGTKIPAWIRLDGVEIANWARTSEYLAAGLAGPRLHLHESCGCGYLYRVDGQQRTFHSPSLDPAPWYDPLRPESSQFLGLVINNIQNDPVTTHSVSDLVGPFGGSVLSPTQTIGRRLTVTGSIVASSCAGRDYGVEWLSDRLGDPSCDSCALSTIEYREVCPPADGSYDEMGYWIAYRSGVTAGPTITPGDLLCNLTDVSWTWTSEVGYLYKPAETVIPSTVLAPADTTSACMDFVEWFCGVGGGLQCATISPPIAGAWAAIITINSPDGVGGIDIATYKRCPPDLTVDVPESIIRVANLTGTLIIDSSLQMITHIDVDGQTVSDGTSYISVPAGQQLEWIDVEECDTARCVCFSQSYPCAGGENTTITVELQYRRR